MLLKLLKLSYLARVNSYIFIFYFCFLGISFADANCDLNIKNNSFYEISYIEINITDKRKWQKNLAKLLNQKIYNKWNSDESKARKSKKKHDAVVKFQFKDDLNCEFSAEIKFHGDGGDHIDFRGNFPLSSMNVKLKNGNINNVVNFILFIPETRNKDNEIFTTSFLKHTGFLAPETFYTNVKINDGFYKFIFQEKIRKEFLERNNLVEGPIYGGHENFYRYEDFERVARIQNSNWIKEGNKDRLELTFNLLDFVNLLYLKDAKLNRNLYIEDVPFLEIDLDILYKNEMKEISEFDAMMYLLSGYHSLRGDNRRLYYHPILHEFLPIYYDGEVTILNKTVENFFIDFENNHKRSDFDRIHFPIPPYSVTVGINGVKKYLEKVNNKNLLNQLKLRGLNISEKKLEMILERIMKRYDKLSSITIKKPDLNLNQSVYKKYSNNISDRLVFKNKNNQKSNYIHCNFIGTFCKEVYLNFKDQIDLLKQNYKKKNLVEYQYINSSFDDYKSGKIIRKKLGIKKYNTQIIDNNFIVKYNDYIKIDIDEKKKILKIDQIDHRGRLIISHSTINDWKILFHGKKTNKKNQLIVDNLTGCITIVNSKIKNISFFANKAYCEDAINFVNSVGNIREIIIESSISDAVDADFSELTFEKILIKNSYNDCLDLSFGNYILVSGTLNNCGDKAISVGEKSSLNIKKVLIENSNIGVASKDSSVVKIKDANIVHVKNCLSAYNKKQEFYGGNIIVEKLNCKNFLDKIEKDFFSSIEILNEL